MIKVENLSYSFPEKDLYRKISFKIEEGDHAVLIGSNGTGKTTLLDMIVNGEEYLYTGRIRMPEGLKTGYVSQYVEHDRDIICPVFDYLARDFEDMLKEQDELCQEMEKAEDIEDVLQRYQECLDDFASVDGDNYEVNIHRQLKMAGLTRISRVPVNRISGGEFKLIRIIRGMMRHPGLLILDEPDVFLDFDNLAGLRDLINVYPGTILAVTHNRFLLNHCFDRILHLEGGDIQEFEGSYPAYQLALLSGKIERMEGAARDREEILRQQKLVERMRKEAAYIDNPAKGRQVKARASLLKRLEENAIKEPFLELRQPEFRLSSPKDDMPVNADDPPANPESVRLLEIRDYHLAYEDVLLDKVSLTLEPGVKAALAGPNGTGKTSLLEEIWRRNRDEMSLGFMSQVYHESFSPEDRVEDLFGKQGTDVPADLEKYLENYCFSPEMAGQKIGQLSGGERNLLQLALLGVKESEALLLDEPSSHLDLPGQAALEKAIREYPGTVLMVSHDFYTIANCMDLVFYVEDRDIRRMSARAFRKMIYRRYFPSQSVETEKRKRELEDRIRAALKNKDTDQAGKYRDQLADLIDG